MTTCPYQTITSSIWLVGFASVFRRSHKQRDSWVPSGMPKGLVLQGDSWHQDFKQLGSLSAVLEPVNWDDEHGITDKSSSQYRNANCQVGRVYIRWWEPTSHRQQASSVQHCFPWETVFGVASVALDDEIVLRSTPWSSLANTCYQQAELHYAGCMRVSNTCGVTLSRLHDFLDSNLSHNFLPGNFPHEVQVLYESRHKNYAMLFHNLPCVLLVTFKPKGLLMICRLQRRNCSGLAQVLHFSLQDWSWNQCFVVLFPMVIQSMAHCFHPSLSLKPLLGDWSAANVRRRNCSGLVNSSYFHIWIFACQETHTSLHVSLMKSSLSFSDLNFPFLQSCVEHRV